MLIYIPSDQLVETDGSSEVIVVAPRRHPEHSNLPRQQFYLSAGGRTGTVVSHLVRFSSISTGFDEEGRRATWADDQPTKRWSVEKMVRVQAEGVDWLVLDDCLRQVSQPCFLSAIPPRGFHRYRVRVRLVIATFRDLPMFEAYVKRNHWQLGAMYRIGNMPFGPIEKECADKLQVAESMPVAPGTTVIVTADPDDESAPTGVLIIGGSRNGLHDAILDLDAPLSSSGRELYQTASWIEGIPDEPTMTEHHIIRLVARIEELEPSR